MLRRTDRDGTILVVGHAATATHRRQPKVEGLKRRRVRGGARCMRRGEAVSS
jgi:hypothetical protein